MSAARRPLPWWQIIAWWLAIGLWLALFIVPNVHAEPGNVAGIAPGLCDYPSICTSGAAFGEYDYAEFWPIEVNGAQRTCLLGGAMYSGTAGVSVPFVNFSVTTPIGVIRGACWYACPGPLLEQADWPNPPGAWKNTIHPPKCRPIGPAPIPINVPSNEATAGPTLPPAQPPSLPNQTNPGAAQPFQPEEPGTR
jgi:hypothetical protein